jgi:hypothetical protein
MPVDYRVEARIAYLMWLANEDKTEAKFTALLRDYYSGKQPVRLTDRQKEFLGLRRQPQKTEINRHKLADWTRENDYDDELFAHNLCKLVVASVVERLKIKGFTPSGSKKDQAPSDESNADPLTTAAMKWWDDNRMESKQDDLYEAACRDGEAFLIVDWDAVNGNPRWTLNFKYDGTQGVKLHRDPVTNDPLFASKRWQTFDPTTPDATGKQRMTLYFPDRVEKYELANSGKGITGKLGDIELQSGWAKYQEPGEPWPIPWMDEDDKPLGLAVIPFLNPGGSEIEDAIPLQDMLNKSEIDLIAASDMSGFRILYASGLDAQLDPDTNQEKPIRVSPAHLIRLTNPNARIGAVEAGGIESEITASKYWTESIAGITRTPQYLFQAFGAQIPSGDSLKMQEVGLIAKVGRKHGVFGNSWEDVVTLSAKLYNKFIGGLILKRIKAEWHNATRRDEVELLDNALKKLNLGIPKWQIWAELGYDQELIDKFEKAAADLAQARLDMARTAFDRGINPNNQPQD